jgi:hypothetical protein
MIPLPNLMRLPAVPFFFFPPAAKRSGNFYGVTKQYWSIPVQRTYYRQL